jgi:flagellar hook protein FlgE
MPLSASLNVGVSALKSFAEGIQVTSNNISNVNTIGYKTSRAQYSDTFSNLLKPLVPNNANTGVKIPPTQIGGGVQIESVSAVFSQGTIQTSSNNSDLAIAGAGFFMVKDVSTGKTMATRAGNFRLDSDGYLVTQQGYRVQGASGAKTRVEYNASLGTIDVKGPQDNLAVTAKSLNQELDYLYLPSVDGIDVGSVVQGAGIIYGTQVTSVDPLTNKVTLSRKPSVTTTEPATQENLLLTKGSPYASLAGLVQGPTVGEEIWTALNKFPAGQYLGGAGVTPGTVVTRVNRANEGSSPVSVTLAAAANNITTITVASAADLSVGMRVSFGVGVASGTYITAINGNQITLSGSLTGNVNDVYKFDKTPFLEATATGTGGLPFLNLSPTDAAKLSVGMRVRSGTGATGSYITDINASTGVITLSTALSTTAVGSYVFDPTLTLSAPVGELPEGAKVTVSASNGQNITFNSSVNGLEVGMQVVTGTGAAGQFITAIDYANRIVTLSGTPSPSPSSGDIFEFSPAIPTWVSSYKFPSLSFSNYYTPALNVGDVRVSFEIDQDYDLVDTSNNSLSGLARAEAADLAPRIRTFNVGATGEISVILSNGQTFKAGYVLLQAFKDPGALIREGSNMFSGVDTAGFFNGAFEAQNIENLIPGTRGLGAINGGGLELSNVDLGEEFSNMIITQRAFQAGSRVISTTDAMMEEVVNLKR